MASLYSIDVLEVQDLFFRKFVLNSTDFRLGWRASQAGAPPPLPEVEQMWPGGGPGGPPGPLPEVEQMMLESARERRFAVTFGRTLGEDGFLSSFLTQI